MPSAAEAKIQCSVNLSPRTVTIVSAEAKRLGISFSDQVRRVTDMWADTLARQQEKPPEKILVLDRDRDELRRAR